jgi:hypothetical protein
LITSPLEANHGDRAHNDRANERDISVHGLLYGIGNRRMLLQTVRDVDEAQQRRGQARVGQVCEPSQ